MLSIVAFSTPGSGLTGPPPRRDGDGQRNDSCKAVYSALLAGSRSGSHSSFGTSFVSRPRATRQVRKIERSWKSEPIGQWLMALSPVDLMAGLNVLVHAVDVLLMNRALLTMGAVSRPAIMSGEIHRLFTSSFLHFNLMHLAVNMMSLRNVGGAVIQFYGKRGFLGIYLLGGIGSSVGSAMFHGNFVRSAGASGAIFALTGAFATALFVNRRELNVSRPLKSIARVMALNLLLGLAPGSGVDNVGHMSGLVTGLVCGFLGAKRFRRVKTR
ncbi:RHOMBOID-like protein 10, chloroplastic [Porphyridium purpureum]|uniref:RHOMBOID-like protein 10, chloroplastic n=1 Tax=Porphyridium purpureum TaxID=35688 RepID=A0A5J4YTM2_PORPP|nr:RHOMBOID-like protein 10, chloroplastic [Porphyridium purpureum]|eukprot:POR6599..scf227_4